MDNALAKKEQNFYTKTTKREMFLLIEQFSELVKNDEQDWVDKAKEELKIIKNNGIE